MSATTVTNYFEDEHCYHYDHSREYHFVLLFIATMILTAMFIIAVILLTGIITFLIESSSPSCQHDHLSSSVGISITLSLF